MPFETTPNGSGNYNGLCFPNSAGTCRVSNDPYITTFDGDWLAVYGLAEYVFSEYGNAFYNFNISLNNFKNIFSSSILSVYLVLRI